MADQSGIDDGTRKVLLIIVIPSLVALALILSVGISCYCWLKGGGRGRGAAAGVVEQQPRSVASDPAASAVHVHHHQDDLGAQLQHQVGGVEPQQTTTTPPRRPSQFVASSSSSVSRTIALVPFPLMCTRTPPSMRVSKQARGAEATL